LWLLQSQEAPIRERMTRAAISSTELSFICCYLSTANRQHHHHQRQLTPTGEWRRQIGGKWNGGCRKWRWFVVDEGCESGVESVVLSVLIGVVTTIRNE